MFTKMMKRNIESSKFQRTMWVALCSRRSNRLDEERHRGTRRQVAGSVDREERERVIACLGKEG